MLYREELQDVCDTLELPRSGNKAYSWSRIIDEIELSPIKEIVIDLKIGNE